MSICDPKKWKKVSEKHMIDFASVFSHQEDASEAPTGRQTHPGRHPRVVPNDGESAQQRVDPENRKRKQKAKNKKKTSTGPSAEQISCGQ